MITPLEALQRYRTTYMPIKEYDDIFSYSVKGRSMDVPPREFDVDKKLWEASAHVAATTWGNAANQRDADKEILLATRGASPQPEDA